MKIVLAALLAIAFAAADPKTVTGTWNMGIQGDHVIPTALVLKQDDKKLTGTVALPTQNVSQRVEVELSGEIAAGAFKLTGTVENASDPTSLTITGALKDDGSLEGRLVMKSHGRDHDLPWTAERLKERK
jgi:hypothetical protein